MSDKRAERQAAAGRFVTYERSGDVSVRLGDYLQTDAGKKQLETIKEMRTSDTASASGELKNR